MHIIENPDNLKFDILICTFYMAEHICKDFLGGIVVRILHHVHQLHDVCIFVPMRLFGEKAAWVHQAHDTEHLNLFYMMIQYHSFN